MGNLSPIFMIFFVAGRFMLLKLLSFILPDVSFGFFANQMT
jgi:hypothetical protein